MIPTEFKATHSDIICELTAATAAFKKANKALNDADLLLAALSKSRLPAAIRAKLVWFRRKKVAAHRASIMALDASRAMKVHQFDPVAAKLAYAREKHTRLEWTRVAADVVLRS